MSYQSSYQSYVPSTTGNYSSYYAGSYGAYYYTPPIIQAYVFKTEVSMLRYISDKKDIDADVSGLFGYSPLHVIARYGTKNMLSYWLRLGPEIKVCECDGNTPLHEAAMSFVDCDDKIGILLSHEGINIGEIMYAENIDGMTAKDLLRAK